ncbi:MAG: hypothetical protein WA874_20600 [Chryseosolibacter sp.]
MTRQIFAAEISIDDAPHLVREKFNENESNVKAILVELRGRVDEVFILATRQRFTVYIVNDSLQVLTDFFHSEHNLKGYVQYYYNTGESVSHLMATASGLLSPVKGEENVLGDIRKCYQWASNCACLGITLDHTLTKVIDTGKTVRTATAIGHFCASVIETGLELLYGRMENLHKRNFLIVGTGKLARLALEYLAAEGIPNVALTGEDASQLSQLAKKYSVKTFPITSLSDYFYMADVIIGVSHQEVNLDFLNPEENKEENRNPFVLDLGMPPNFNAQLVEKYAAEFYNLDDLRRLQPSPLEAFGGLELAWRMVVKTSNDFVHLLKLLEHSPILTAYLSRQFNQKNGEWKVKPKRTLRHFLLFRKGESATGLSPAKESFNEKVHTNNYQAENAVEIIRHFSKPKSFKFMLPEN